MLEPLTDDELVLLLRDIVEHPHWSVAVTLLTGDTVIGSLLPQRVPYSDVGKRFQAYYPKKWATPTDASSATALWLQDVTLVYPSGHGARGTQALEVTASVVAAIRPLGWRLNVAVSGIRGRVAAAISYATRLQPIELVYTPTGLPPRPSPCLAK